MHATWILITRVGYGAFSAIQGIVLLLFSTPELISGNIILVPLLEILSVIMTCITIHVCMVVDRACLVRHGRTLFEPCLHVLGWPWNCVVVVIVVVTEVAVVVHHWVVVLGVASIGIHLHFLGAVSMLI